MACASCMRKADSMKAVANGMTTASSPQPFMAADIQVVDGGEVRKFQASDWDNDRHKLLIQVPEAFTVVCETEVGAMSEWYHEFQRLNCELIAVCTDPAPMLLDWQNSEPLLKDPPYKMFSSYMLPSRLGLLDNGRGKRASVFVTAEGEVVKMEHFNKVGRSFKDLHRMLHGYTTGSYCSEGWSDPSDGFLQPKD